jgi:hypothetical protein
MLLETTDIKRNDVLIYSGNKFDFENNFKIVFKKNTSKKPESISFYDIGKYINLPVPKNLIVYRLMTNHLPFNANITKFGFLISIESIVELIYFDPIFALKDIDLIKKSLNLDTFRFKIQQVGLTSLSKKGTALDFTEIFSFDLKAEEAVYQNDRVYAEAIFAFDLSFPSEEEYLLEFLPQLKNDNQNLSVVTSESFIRAKVDLKERMSVENNILSENKNTNFDEQNVDVRVSIPNESKENITQQNYENELKEFHEKIVDHKDSNQRTATTDEPHSSISEFLRRHRANLNDNVNEIKKSGEDNKFMNLFKSTSNLGNYLRERAKESFILKIEK